jgi:hypothetical protein
MVQNLLTQLSELIVNSEDIRLDEIPEYPVGGVLR